MTGQKNMQFSGNMVQSPLGSLHTETKQTSEVPLFSSEYSQSSWWLYFNLSFYCLQYLDSFPNFIILFYFPFFSKFFWPFLYLKPAILLPNNKTNQCLRVTHADLIASTWLT